jgi:hypothetical protein
VAVGTGGGGVGELASACAAVARGG